MGWIGAVIGGVASLWGSSKSSKGARESNAAQIAADKEMQVKAMDFSRESQHEAMGWNEMMSNSAMQRRVADLKAAGLNPALAYSQGASAPTMSGQSGQGGNVGSLQNPDASYGNLGSNISQGMSAYSAAQVQKSQVENVKAQTAATNAQAAKTQAEAQVVEAQVPYSAENALNQKRVLERQAHMLEDQVDGIMKDNQIKDLNISQLKQLQPLLVQYQNLMNQAAKLGMSEKEADAAFFEKMPSSEWFKVLDAVRRVVSSGR